MVGQTGKTVKGDDTAGVPDLPGKFRTKDQICVGLLAHVDAGKTTLAEGILYLTGRIRSLGRVDHQDAFFDNFELERSRGITIFSKQAQVLLEPKRVGEAQALPENKRTLSVTLLDTPGHVDFSAEMERTLQVLDYAILVISGSDGVQSHVETLWRLLTLYEIPVFLFVNKMDQPGTDRSALLEELTQKLDDRCVDFTVPHDSEEFQENLAMCDEELLESYLSGNRIGDDAIARLIASRQVFPCYFGSALKLQGVEELLEGLRVYSEVPEYPEEFGARVFKITRDAQGNRLTHMKITGGALRVKDMLSNQKADRLNRKDALPLRKDVTSVRPDNTSGERNRFARAERKVWEEKINQIRIFSGANYETAAEAPAGTVCAVTGLNHTYAGEGLGIEPEGELPVLEPVLSYRVELPEGTDVHRAYRQLKQLEEEEPQLHITWAAGAQMRRDGREQSSGSGAAGPEGQASAPEGSDLGGEIHAQLMGEVQTEILQNVIRDRFGLAVRFGEGCIVYRETIASPVVGMGHFEPLRHYAEVHLLMEPMERGSGLQFESDCSVDELDLNWQRLVLTHLEEKPHMGVLTGSEITDMKITLVAGRAHQKHTEGGDFRQATYRAVRQGLCRAESVLLEPVYSFRMEIPMESVGRALSDIQRMYGKAGPPVPVNAARTGYSGAAGGPGGAMKAVGGSEAADKGSAVGGSDTMGYGSMPGSFGTVSDMVRIEGTAPVVSMRGYQKELLSYTKGRGHLFCRLKGYEECHNAQEIIEQRAYDAQADTENPCGSVFCAHGAGFVVNWKEVPDYVHIRDTDAYAEAARRRMCEGSMESGGSVFTSGADADKTTLGSGAAGIASSGSAADDEELRAIFERTYGKTERDRSRSPYGKNQSRRGSGWAGYEASQTPSHDALRQTPPSKERNAPHLEDVQECLLVDGYNIIFAWDELKELAESSLDSARCRLLDLMSNYQGYKNNNLIVVFDAYRVSGQVREISRYHNIYVVYTKEAETADQYIEKTVRRMKSRYHVTVATSDALEQVIILGAGALRLSARGLREEIEQMQKDLREQYLGVSSKGGKTYLLDGKEEALRDLPDDASVSLPRDEK